MSAVDFEHILAEAQSCCEQLLDDYLPSADTAPTRLHEAMRYAVFAGGKRFRPALVLACTRLCGGSDEQCHPIMAAVEMLHTYTLVHDDLPAMDNDDLRRGKPTCHKAFDEATAILCGDALLTRSLGLIASHSAAAAMLLADACGSLGVVGGQQDDLDTNNAVDQHDEALLMRIHERKTAALISASCALGAMAADASTEDIQACADYGQQIGIAFQITDDLLDVTAASSDIGKTAGKDQDQNKLTSVSLFGIDTARKRAHDHVAKAKSALAGFDERADTLRRLADFILTRNT